MSVDGNDGVADDGDRKDECDQRPEEGLSGHGFHRRHGCTGDDEWGVRRASPMAVRVQLWNRTVGSISLVRTGFGQSNVFGLHTVRECD